MPVSQDAAAKAGAKRKRATATKFYAVQLGHGRGVYNTWNECLEQVKGYKGAKFKSFPTLTEAERYVAGENVATAKGSTSTPHKFYAVRRGRLPGIYTDWPSAQNQITGWAKPVYKSFSTKSEAEGFLKEESEVGFSATSLGKNSADAKAPLKEPTNKKAKTAGNSTIMEGARLASQEALEDGYEPGIQLPVGAEDGFDTNIILNKGTSDVVFKNETQREASKLKATGLSDSGPLRIFTDGSSLRNGQKGAFAGVGVYFGPLDPRNISESLPGVRQTNQRAELTALVRALDTAPKDRDVTIVTDSEYAINCSTKWSVTWQKNGWRTSTGKQVDNKDIVENILSRLDERKALQSETKFEWIKGHANLDGNVQADKLAVDGARRASQAPSGKSSYDQQVALL